MTTPVSRASSHPAVISHSAWFARRRTHRSHVSVRRSCSRRSTAQLGRRLRCRSAAQSHCRPAACRVAKSSALSPSRLVVHAITARTSYRVANPTCPIASSPRRTAFDGAEDFGFGQRGGVAPLLQFEHTVIDRAGLIGGPHKGKIHRFGGVCRRHSTEQNRQRPARTTLVLPKPPADADGIGP